ncbi:MAG: DUF4115 domain-containing protein [Candidatus Kapabacteria bacterium]|nr:DUF4115 domain-containing protein [Candidatus Kapabacteria bacterium]
MQTLAERLRAERERQRRSLREVSAETKIREPFLAAIERGDFDVLPQVYVRSFLKTYAAALGIPRNQVDALIAQALERDEHDDAPTLASRRRPSPTSQAPSRQPDRETHQPRTAAGGDSTNEPTSDRRSLDQRLGSTFMDVVRSLPLWVWIATGVIIAAIVIGLLMRNDEEPASTNAGPANVVTVEETTPVVDSMILRAEVMDSAWITITADGKTSYQAILLPGTSAQWSAMERFDISMGNAGGVVFYRDDVRLEPFAGPKQSVRKVVVTRTTVVTPSTAWTEQPATPAPATKPPRDSARGTGERRRTSAKTPETPAITPVRPR